MYLTQAFWLTTQLVGKHYLPAPAMSFQVRTELPVLKVLNKCSALAEIDDHLPQ